MVLSLGGIVGSSYVMVSATKWATVCVSRNGPLYGLKLWYQSISFEISKVIVFGSFLAEMRAKWMACCKSDVLWGWA